MEENLYRYICESDNIVFFGGAGVSCESGIPDFRSTDGLYHLSYRWPPEEILSHHFFMDQPEEFFRFYREKMLYPDAKPNAAHLALAKLERQGKLKAVVTQNIDGLHQAAGSRNVLELHGSVHRNHCMCCHRAYFLQDVMQMSGVPHCPECGGIIKPDVVLYEEALDEKTILAAVQAIAAADLLIVGGTSLNVYPAAGLLRYFCAGKLVVINKTPTPADESADLIIQKPIGEVFEKMHL